MNPAKFILTVEYDGTSYHGFQWQVGLPTIQDELEQAMKKFCGQSSRIMAASRTDAGVHAKEQVVSFWAEPTLSPGTLVKALNHYLPTNIAVKAAYKASEDFDVRRDALSRVYHYYILNRDTRSPFSQRFALFLPQTLDVEVMNQACQLLQGEHDFASFASSLNGSRSTVRNIYQAEVDKEEGFVVFRVVANSFLTHQVRNTVGLLLQLARGRISIKDFRDVMEARSLALAGPTVPACGLCLIKVNYPEYLFPVILSEAKNLCEVSGENL